MLTVQHKLVEIQGARIDSTGQTEQGDLQYLIWNKKNDHCVFSLIYIYIFKLNDLHETNCLIIIQNVFTELQVLNFGFWNMIDHFSDIHILCIHERQGKEREGNCGKNINC